jgi:4-cresol dehydrogenase (hydroxylating)
LEAWREALGAEHVIAYEQALSAAQTATFATSQRVAAIVRPADREQVRACLRVADRYGVPIYPISRGLNWGYGSRVPARDGCAIMDLGRMNRILDFSEKYAYVTVEPGVTFRQVFDFLAAQGSNLMLNTPGGPFEGSVVGNLLERGIGAGLYGDRAQHACDFEVVLPTGEVIHTGFGRFDTPLAPLHAAGVGPRLEGLFTQSNLGVVTRLTLWLAPKPAYFHTFYFSLNRPDRLGGLLAALRGLKLGGPAGAHYSLWNDYKLLATLQRYPWRAAGGRTPLPDDVLADLRERWEIARWNGFGALYSGSRRQGLAERDLISRALRGQVGSLTFVSDTEARAARLLGRPLRWLAAFDTKAATAAHDRDASAWFGGPHSSLGSAYWRKPAPPPARMDLDADGCGLLWCSVCVPFDGAHAGVALDIVARSARAYRFEPQVALLCAAPRALHVIVAIVYDRCVAGEDTRALACHGMMSALLAQPGYLPYRLGIQSMGMLPAPTDDSAAVHERLKRALDPNGTLAPGRYEG